MKQLGVWFLAAVALLQIVRSTAQYESSGNSVEQLVVRATAPTLGSQYYVPQTKVSWSPNARYDVLPCGCKRKWGETKWVSENEVDKSEERRISYKDFPWHQEGNRVTIHYGSSEEENKKKGCFGKLKDKMKDGAKNTWEKTKNLFKKKPKKDKNQTENNDYYGNNIADVYSWISVFIIPVNSAFNPLLYTLTTPKYREVIKYTITRRMQPLSKFRNAMSTTDTISHTSSQKNTTGYCTVSVLSGTSKNNSFDMPTFNTSVDRTSSVGYDDFCGESQSTGQGSRGNSIDLPPACFEHSTLDHYYHKETPNTKCQGV